MAKVVMFGNSKGGVAKTTSAVNTADILAFRKHKVLLIDMDPQGHCSIALNYNPLAHFNTISDVLTGDAKIDETILHYNEFFDVIPSNIKMFDTEEKIKQEILSYFLLYKKITPLKSRYDYIIIDTPPNLGTFVLNSLIASDLLVVPIDSSFLGIEGYMRLKKIVENKILPAVSRPIVIRILLTLFDSRTRMSKDIREDVERKLGPNSIFSSVINRNTDVQKSLAQGVPIRVYCEENHVKVQAKLDYEGFVEELLAIDNYV